MVSISFLIAVNSASSAERWVSLTVPVAASVARVTARFRRLVICDRAPSATCNMPTPSEALRTDCVRAVTLAFRPLAIAKPAASSAPELMRCPVDNRCNVWLNDASVMDSEFCACRDEILFRMLSDIENSPFQFPPASDAWGRGFTDQTGLVRAGGLVDEVTNRHFHPPQTTYPRN